jgi:hypothetical protein
VLAFSLLIVFVVDGRVDVTAAAATLVLLLATFGSDDVVVIVDRRTVLAAPLGVGVGVGVGVDVGGTGADGANVDLFTAIGRPVNVSGPVDDVGAEGGTDPARRLLSAILTLRNGTRAAWVVWVVWVVWVGLLDIDEEEGATPVFIVFWVVADAAGMGFFMIPFVGPLVAATVLMLGVVFVVLAASN